MSTSDDHEQDPFVRALDARDRAQYEQDLHDREVMEESDPAPWWLRPS